MKTLALLLSFLSLPLFAQSVDTVDHLTSFTKLYGYVRYFHPSDEAANLDWERFASYGANRVKEIQDPNELLPLLKELFEPIAPTLQIYQTGEKPSEPPFKPSNPSSYNKITWQHYGLGNDFSTFTYTSSRLYRYSYRPMSPEFFIYLKLPEMGQYAGQKLKFEYRASLKDRHFATTAYPILYSIPKNGNIYPKPQMKPSMLASDWQAYETTATMKTNTEEIILGFLVKGHAELRVDDLQLSVQDDTGTWQTIHLNNGDFESEEISDWKSQRLVTPRKSRQKEEDNHVLFLTNYMKMTKPEKNPINEVFDGKSSVEMGEVFEKSIGSGLSITCPLTVYGNSSETVPKSGERLTQLTEAIAKVDANRPHPDLYLGNLVITWNVFQHFYPYWHVVDKDWEAVLKEGLSKVLNNKYDSLGFRDKVLIPLIHELEDGHGYVSFPLGAERNKVFLPFAVAWIEDDVVITHSEHPQIKPGDILLTIKGEDSRVRFDRFTKMASGSIQYRRHVARNYLIYVTPEETPLILKRENEIIKISLDVTDTAATPVEEKPNYEAFTELEPNIWYVNLDIANETMFKLYLERLSQAKAIIWDLRGYPKMFKFMTHLIQKPIFTSRLEVPVILYPDQEQMSFHEIIAKREPATPFFPGKMIFLTNGAAISAAETLLAMVSTYQIGEIIGEPTAGANGNINLFKLPGGYQIRWTGMHVQRRDRTPVHTRGIQPTIPLSRTIKAVREGRDNYVEKALELIHQMD